MISAAMAPWLATVTALPMSWHSERDDHLLVGAGLLGQGRRLEAVHELVGREPVDDLLEGPQHPDDPLGDPVGVLAVLADDLHPMLFGALVHAGELLRTAVSGDGHGRHRTVAAHGGRRSDASGPAHGPQGTGQGRRSRHRSAPWRRSTNAGAPAGAGPRSTCRRIPRDRPDRGATLSCVTAITASLRAEHRRSRRRLPQASTTPSGRRRRRRRLGADVQGLRESTASSQGAAVDGQSAVTSRVPNGGRGQPGLVGGELDFGEHEDRLFEHVNGDVAAVVVEVPSLLAQFGRGSVPTTSYSASDR